MNTTADDQETTPTSADRLRRWNRTFNPFVVVAAILPLGPVIAGADPTEGPGALLSFGCWFVFAIDFAVRSKLGDHFLSTWKGRVYLLVVVVTFPFYFVIPSLEEADVLAFARLGWVVVLAVAGAESVRDVHVLLGRVGAAGLYAAAAVFVATVVVNRVEEPEDGFATFGDGLWWAIATITTVGYGDRVPVTTPGRFVATLLMISGLAFLGVIAASLASFFGLGDANRESSPDAADNQRYDELLDEIRSLRNDVARLRGPANSADDPS